jgi:uncharacterized membrane protein YgcG
MTTAFRGGDLAGGIVDAMRQIAAAAGRKSVPAIEAKSSTAVAVRSGH